MTTSTPLFTILQSILVLVGIVVTALGAVVAASCFKRSRWAGIVALGFALQVSGMLASQFLFPILAIAGAGDASGFARGALGISILGTIARVVVVAGVIGLLVEFRRGNRKVEPA